MRGIKRPAVAIAAMRIEDGAEVFCPVCKWVPPRAPLWMCLPVCGCVWDTFSTRGVCPECGEEFEHTQCIGCGVLSLHSSWYHWPETDSERDEQKDVVKA